jgi:lipid A 3-O-deacylase
MKSIPLQIGICFLCPMLFFGQKIDHTVSFRTIESDSYFRFNYDNDYFAATDENYTQGYNLELVLPSLSKNPINALFLKTENTSTVYGLAIEHIGFTPNNYASDEIQFGDRPFAAAIMLKSFKISTDTNKKSRITSSLSLGLMGPGAFGEEMQVGIHKVTGNKIPMGWQHQIRNDVVVNYGIDYEKQLLEYGDLMTLQAQFNVQFGTLFSNVSTGLNGTIGLINSAYSESDSPKKFQVYVYSQAFATVVGYDATLQGGLFSKESPYTIASGDVERLKAQFNYGLIVKTKTLYFEYSRSAITKEFETGQSAKWGGIRIGFIF